MADRVSYLDAAAAAALVAQELPSADRRRVIFLAASATDQLIHCARATAQIDHVGYAGARTEGDAQTTAWPRVDDFGVAVEPDADDPVVSAGSALVTGCPRGVYLACALQAAQLAADNAGVGARADIERAVHWGLTGHSGRGRSESYDANYARGAWAALCPEAKALLEPYRRKASRIV
ncbi:MAG: hypothetical protein H6826_14335 [Planctomycetes bacterium]|nr:hypothetical protein [Planctomycetota bacterium]